MIRIYEQKNMTTKKKIKNRRLTKKKYSYKLLRKRKIFSAGNGTEAQSAADPLAGNDVKTAADPLAGNGAEAQSAAAPPATGTAEAQSAAAPPATGTAAAPPATGTAAPLAGNDVNTAAPPATGTTAEAQAATPAASLAGTAEVNTTNGDVVSDNNPSIEKELELCRNWSRWYYQQNQYLMSKIFKLQYPGIPPLEYQVRSATNVPYFKPQRLYGQIEQIEKFLKGIKLDKKNLTTTRNGLNAGRTLNELFPNLDKIDPLLYSVGIIVRKENRLFKDPTENFFFKVEFLPPEDEVKFSAINPIDGVRVQIKYPAVAFMRCRIENEEFVIHGIYLATSNTAIIDNGSLLSNKYEAKLIGFLLIESREKYEQRRKIEEKPVNMIANYVHTFDLKINGVETEMKFIWPPGEVNKLEKAIMLEQSKIPDEMVKAINEAAKNQDIPSPNTDLDVFKSKVNDTPIGENKSISYAINRFHISGNIKEQKFKNAIKNIVTSAPTINETAVLTGEALKTSVLSTTKNVGKSVVSAVADNLTGLINSGGGKDTNMKYTIKKIKNRKKRNTKKYKKYKK
jgi:hypothetical protein